MNVATVKTLLWLVSFGLAGGLVWFAYDHRTGVQVSYFEQAYAEDILRDVVRPEAPPRRAADYEEVKATVNKFDWTGAPPKVVEEKAPEPTGPVEAPKVPVEDILTVLMIRVDTDDPGGSSALVKWKPADLKDQSPHLHVGLTLPKPHDFATVKAITADAVEFAFADEEREAEVLTPPSDLEEGIIVDVKDGKPIKPRRPGSLLGPRKSSTSKTYEETRRVAKNLYDLGTKDMEAFGKDYTRILTEDVKTSTHYVNGKRAGIKIESVKAGSIAARHGVQSGEVVISVNGHAVSSEQEAIKFAKNNKDKYTVWDVVIQDQYGKTRTQTYRSDQND